MMVKVMIFIYLIFQFLKNKFIRIFQIFSVIVVPDLMFNNID
jgi:hypothetical protein